jgi:hypothetical protein
MRFTKGHSGNPKGRPIGSLNKHSRLAVLLESHAEALINKTVELALAGDINALRLCIERLMPKAQRESLSVVLPDITQTETSSTALLAHEIIKSLAGDVVTIEQAKLLLTLNRQLELSNKQALDDTNEQVRKEAFELRAQLDAKYQRDY